jgi:myo-inositol 2-dehydrogenase/D-chiro-inositol 1-dehydrogenase
LARNALSGPTAYDGYANNAVVDAALQTLASGHVIAVDQAQLNRARRTVVRPP